MYFFGIQKLKSRQKLIVVLFSELIDPSPTVDGFFIRSPAE